MGRKPRPGASDVLVTIAHRDGLAAIHDELEGRMRRWVRRGPKRHQPCDVDVILAESFEECHFSWRTFHGADDPSLLAWARTITFRTVYRKFHRQVDSVSCDAINEPTVVDEDLAVAQFLVTLPSRLSTTCRHLLAGHTEEEIATDRHVTRWQVRMDRIELRKLLASRAHGHIALLR